MFTKFFSQRPVKKTNSPQEDFYKIPKCIVILKQQKKKERQKRKDPIKREILIPDLKSIYNHLCEDCARLSVTEVNAIIQSRGSGIPIYTAARKPATRRVVHGALRFMHSTVSKTGGCLINSTRSAPVCSAPSVQAKIKHKGRRQEGERTRIIQSGDELSVSGRCISVEQIRVIHVGVPWLSYPRARPL